jgi:predicted outer membrane repeat protein
MRGLFQILTLVTTLFVATTVFGDTIVPGGTVSGTWSLTGSPYLIQGDITIHADSVLSIEPGVFVDFQGHYQLYVNGALEALGTAQDSIVFTAANTAEGWRGIRIDAGIDSTHLEYCIIEHGRRTGTALADWGGGVYTASIDAVISHCRVSGCHAYNGGGMYVQSDPLTGPSTISACTFSNNSAEQQGGGLSFCGADLVLTDCLFESNQCGSDGGGGYCWGFFVSSVEITGCTFLENEAESGGGGIFIDHVQNSDGVTISDCEFVSNKSNLDGGGGISLTSIDDVLITNCTFSGNWGAVTGNYLDGGGAIYASYASSTVSFCTFDHNFGFGDGGTIFCRGADVLVESCTFSQNRSWCCGGLRLDADAIIINTIFSGNQKYAIIFESGTHSVEYCDFFDNEFLFYGPVPAGLTEITGVNANGDPCDNFSNILLDPQICDTANGDLRIADNSPCLGAGDGGANIGALGIGCTYTDVPDQPQLLPGEFSLSQNHPNPFNPVTTLEYSLPERSHVTVEIYNVLGQKVRTLIDHEESAGSYTITWDGTDISGKSVATGIYLYRFQSGEYVETKKMLLLK